MDWKKLIQELLDSGMRKAEIAREIGIKPPSLDEILTKEERTDMRWSNGNRLIKLHRQKIKKAA